MDRNHLEHIGLKLYWSAFQMKRAYRRAGIWAADLYCREALDSMANALRPTARSVP